MFPIQIFLIYTNNEGSKHCCFMNFHFETWRHLINYELIQKMSWKYTESPNIKPKSHFFYVIPASKFPLQTLTVRTNRWTYKGLFHRTPIGKIGKFFGQVIATAYEAKTHSSNMHIYVLVYCVLLARSNLRNILIYAKKIHLLFSFNVLI